MAAGDEENFDGLRVKPFRFNMTHQVRFISACFDGEARGLLRDLETKRTREELDTHSTREGDLFCGFFGATLLAFVFCGVLAVFLAS